MLHLCVEHSKHQRIGKNQKSGIIMPLKIQLYLSIIIIAGLASLRLKFI